MSWQRTPLGLLLLLRLLYLKNIYIYIYIKSWSFSRSGESPLEQGAEPGCSCAGDRGHPALLQVLDTEPAGHLFLSLQQSLHLLSRHFPATGATPARLFQGSHGSVARDRCCCSVQSFPSLGVHLLWEMRESSLRAQRAQPGHRPPAHLHTPSAKWCFQLKFLLCSRSVPLSDNSELLYRFSLQSTLQVREKLVPFIFPRTAPSPSQQRCHPPSHRRCC